MIRNKNILDLSEHEAEIELKILAKEIKDADKDYHELDDPKFPMLNMIGSKFAIKKLKTFSLI